VNFISLKAEKGDGRCETHFIILRRNRLGAAWLSIRPILGGQNCHASSSSTSLFSEWSGAMRAGGGRNGVFYLRSLKKRFGESTPLDLREPFCSPKFLECSFCVLAAAAAREGLPQPLLSSSSFVGWNFSRGASSTNRAQLSQSDHDEDDDEAQSDRPIFERLRERVEPRKTERDEKIVSTRTRASESRRGNFLGDRWIGFPGLRV